MRVCVCAIYKSSECKTVHKIIYLTLMYPERKVWSCKILADELVDVIFLTLKRHDTPSFKHSGLSYFSCHFCCLPTGNIWRAIC